MSTIPPEASSRGDQEGVRLPVLKTSIPGPRSQAVWDRAGKYHSPGLSAIAVESKLVMREGRGCWVRDVDGNEFLDFCSGAIVNIIGHSHPELVDAIHTEMQGFLHVYDWMTDARAEFFEALAGTTPQGIDQFQTYVGGSETVEAALRIAASKTKRHEYLSLYRSYHGKTLASRSLQGTAYKKGFGTPAPGFFQTMNPYCYRCPLGLEPTTCGAACADLVQHVFEQQTSGSVAALVMEPIQGAGGIIPLPQQFVEKMRAFCDANGILLVFDETLSAFGRTGKFFAAEHSGVRPDIMTMGKGTAGGYPIGVVGASAETMAEWPWSQPFGGSTTYGGGNVSARAALVTMRIIQRENLVAHGAEVGAMIKQRLEALADLYPVLGDVRGEGMLIGLEFVQDPETKEPINAEQAKFFYWETLKRGLLLNTIGAIVRITPPLLLSREEAEVGLAILEDAIVGLQDKVARDRVAIAS